MQNEKLKVTQSEENYIKAIYHLTSVEEATVATNTLAAYMDTKPSSVTDMLKKLAEKKLIDYVKYKGAKLSALGKTTALTVIRKHRLWEVFLVKKLNFSWDEVHEVAEQLEHIKSEKLIDGLDKLLDYPKSDPHGDPIPSKNGVLKETKKRLLEDVPIGVQGTCVGVKDSSSTFLKFLDKIKIGLGDTIVVIDKEQFDGSMHIKTNLKSMRVSNQIAANLYIEIEDDL